MRKQLDKYNGDWDSFYKELMNFTTEDIVRMYFSDFKEMFNRGSSPDRAVRVITKTNFR